MVCSLLLVRAQSSLNMVQSCGVKPPFNVSAVTLECKHGSKNLHIRRSQGDNPDDQDLMFKGQTSLIPQGNRTFTVTLTNVTKQDEGNYSCCLPEYGICSNVIPMKIPQMNKEDEGNYNNSPHEQKLVKASTVTPTEILQTNNETDNQTGSALSSGDITAIVLGGVLLGVVVVGGILAFRYCRRNRNRTDLQPDSSSIALRIMEEGESSQPALDGGGADPEQVSRPFIDDHLNQSHDGDVPDHYSEGGAEAAAGKRNDL
ncbi:uncharacterized protein LOC105358671 [Oryzias latipes]|uniref:uncharacterized protein LOC105358671 n=1 Tax=Oryzias latipes TaxID=8090 RepID=UPI0005CC6F4F|nr:uncharacterized protein LOC105358671 [Oryzias latipes]